VWEFGQEQLAASGEETAVREHHAVYFRDLAEQTGAAWLGPHYAAWMDRLERERGNLRVALGWLVTEGRAELALEFSCALHYFWRARGPVGEALDWFSRIDTLSAPVPERPRINALVVAGDLATVGGNTVLALERMAEAVRGARMLGDVSLLAWALQTEGRAWLLARDPARAAASVQEALDLFRRQSPAPHEPAQFGTLSQIPALSQEAADCIVRALLLSNFAVAVFMGGDAHGAVALHEEAQGLADAQAFAYLQAANTLSLADAVRETGDLDRAERLYREGLRLSREQNEQRNVAVALAGCAAVAAARKQAAHAAWMCGAASAILDRVGSSLTSGGHLSYEAAESMARAALGVAAYDAAWHDGYALAFEKAIERAFPLPRTDPGATAPLLAASRPEPGALSRREREVLALLASGQSNQQIADALFVSRRTVTNHVSSILAKLGVTTRAAAAAHAVRQGLA
jgi:DNA-binding NarL/FixJ family response regulator